MVGFRVVWKLPSAVGAHGVAADAEFEGDAGAVVADVDVDGDSTAERVRVGERRDLRELGHLDLEMRAFVKEVAVRGVGQRRGQGREVERAGTCEIGYAHDVAKLGEERGTGAVVEAALSVGADRSRGERVGDLAFVLKCAAGGRRVVQEQEPHLGLPGKPVGQ